jgi:hypothetical protein
VASAAATSGGRVVPVTTAVQWIGEVVSAFGHDGSDDGARRVARRELVDARSREYLSSNRVNRLIRVRAWAASVLRLPWLSARPRASAPW